MTNNEYQQLVVLLLQHGVLASREEAEALAIKAAHGAAVPPPVKAAIREWLDWESSGILNGNWRSILWALANKSVW